MTTERKERINQLRNKLLSLTEAQRESFASKGLVSTIEGRILSLHNTILLYLQSNGSFPTIVGGYKQWQRARRQVMKDSHGYLIWFPIGTKDEETDNIIEAERFYMATVFDISQTETQS